MTKNLTSGIRILVKHKLGKKKVLAEPLIQCPKCDRKLLDNSGLAGHLRLAHNINVGRKEELKQLTSKLELTLKELADLKANVMPKNKIYACPKCNAGIWGGDFKVVSS